MNFIIEVSNTHGGNIEYVLDLIDEFEKFEGHGMKFQPLDPDKISTSDYEWYNVYKELYFSLDEWSKILNEASKTKLVWLDLFDLYSVEILKKNISFIHGIKLQASVLYNEEVISALESFDCSNLKLILNVSAIDLENIHERVEEFNSRIQPAELLIEVGFQAYPTMLIDSGLSKIEFLKSRFKYEIVFADHVSGESPEAILLPLVASVKGVSYIEKHVKHSMLDTKYDYYSAVKVDKYQELVEKIEEYESLLDQKFINTKEREYLNNTIQKPIAKRILSSGQSISLLEDLLFRRSNQNGLSVKDIDQLRKDGYILSREISVGSTFKRADFKKAIIGVVVACRLKSSRLKRKALLPIGNLTSIEKCLQSCLKLPDSSITVLATSTVDEDSELEKYTYAEHVYFHQGDPDDVIQRYLDVVEKFRIDVVIRVTGDMPYVSQEITKVLLKSHFESGADYTAARDCAVGTAPEIINSQALRVVKSHFPNADYSEYMTWYFQNNKEHFKVNIVDLPEELIRDYRLTLDYQEDLELFNVIESHLEKEKLQGSIDEVFSFLDVNPDYAKLNGHIKLKYRNDEALISRLNSVTKIV